MSAMHWEARRRQSMLDRRMSRDKQLQVQKESTEVRSKLESDVPVQQPAVNECCHCQNKIRHPVQYSAKIDNRYSSTQYSQQW